MTLLIARRLLIWGAIALSAIPLLAPAGAQIQPGTSSQTGDTLYSRPHDIFPEELMRQMPRSTPRSTPLSTGAATQSLYQNVNVSVDTFPQNEPSVKISRKHPNRVVAAWRDFSTGVSPAIRRVGYSLSTDGGANWSAGALLPLVDPVHLRASDPAVGVDTAGTFYIATISINNTNNDGKILVFRSTNEGVTFDTANLAPSIPGTAFDDKEYIASDLNPASPFANALYISWTRFGTPGGIQLTRSAEAGHTWSPMVQVSDGTGGQVRQIEKRGSELRRRQRHQPGVEPPWISVDRRGLERRGPERRHLRDMERLAERRRRCLPQFVHERWKKLVGTRESQQRPAP